MEEVMVYSVDFIFGDHRNLTLFFEANCAKYCVVSMQVKKSASKRDPMQKLQNFTTVRFTKSFGDLHYLHVRKILPIFLFHAKSELPTNG